MAGPYRLDDEIAAYAEATAKSQKRSVSKQIAYWAELGRRVEQKLDHAGLMALMEDRAAIEIRALPPEPIDAEDVFAQLDSDRNSGALSRAVTSARVVYEASPAYPGFLDRIEADGRRVTGYFDSGEFIPGTTRRGAAPASAE